MRPRERCTLGRFLGRERREDGSGDEDEANADDQQGELVARAIGSPSDLPPRSRAHVSCPFEATRSEGRRHPRATSTTDGAPAKNHAAITASQTQHPKDDVSMNGQI